jgi:hypothetical protein
VTTWTGLRLPNTDEELDIKLFMLPELRYDICTGENWLLAGRLCLRSLVSGRNGRLGVICKMNYKKNQ